MDATTPVFETIEVKLKEEYNQGVVFIGDLHIPHHDPVAVKLTLAFIAKFQPGIIFLMGDIADFYAVSSHDKDPLRKETFQEEIDQCIQFLEELREVAPNAFIIFVEGNHENRMLRYLKKRPELASLRNLSVPCLLELDSFDIRYLPYGKIYRFLDMCIEHGDAVSSKSSYTAAKMLDKRLKSGISGHTHRLGVHYRTAVDTELVWYENGCLCKTDPEYISGVANWQQGFTAGVVDNQKERIWMYQMQIKDGALHSPYGVFRCD